MKWLRSLFFTRRDRFIAMAMQGFCSHIRTGNAPDMERAAKMAVQYADLVIGELDEETN